jgi:hypothetical protein
MTLYDQQSGIVVEPTERRVVREIRVVSVFRVTFWMSLCLWGVGGVGLVALYIVGAAAGGLGGFRGFMASLGLTGIWVNPLTFVPLFSAVAIVLSVAAATAGAVVAMLYNALEPLVGGIEIVRKAR